MKPSPLDLSRPSANAPALYEEVFRRAQEAIAVLDADGRYVEQNQAHLLLFGYSDKELLGQTPALQMTEVSFATVMQELMRARHFRGDRVGRRS